MGNVFEQAKDEGQSEQDHAPDLDRLSAEISTRTDLSILVCRELLMNGWSFKQELGKPDRWQKEY